MEKEQEIKKLTLEEYQKKYSKPYNEKAMKAIIFILICVIALVIIFCLFSLVVKIYELCDKNNVALYVSIPVAALIFLLVFVIPLLRLHKIKPFIVDNVSGANLKDVQKHNKKLREDIADKTIDLHAKTANLYWYNDETVGKLAVARQTKDDNALRQALSDMYKNDVKRAANKMIRQQALQVGITTALSQNEKIDTIFAVSFNISLIKNIVYLYGFRPNDKQLVKMYQSVAASALVAYGSGQLTVSLASTVVKKMGKSAESVPFFGALIHTAVDSISQGIINAALCFCG